MQRPLPLCTPARAVRSRGAFDRDYGAVTTTSGLWLRGGAYDARLAQAKSLSRTPHEDRDGGRTRFDQARGSRPPPRLIPSSPETGLHTTYDADHDNPFKWSNPGLPTLGDRTGTQMIAVSIKVWTSNCPPCPPYWSEPTADCAAPRAVYASGRPASRCSTRRSVAVSAPAASTSSVAPRARARRCSRCRRPAPR